MDHLALQNIRKIIRKMNEDAPTMSVGTGGFSGSADERDLLQGMILC